MSDLTLSCSPPTDMARKPKPLPLSYSRALIEREKLAVIQRTAHRIHQLTGERPTESTNNEPSGKWMHYTKVVAIGAIFLLLYSIMLTFFTLHCHCTCNV